MNPSVTTIPVLENLHNEWIGSLLAYDEQLQQLDIVTAQLQMSVNDLNFQQELQQIRIEIALMKKAVVRLDEEVIHLKRKFDFKKRKQNVNLDVIIENNRLRNKIRKSEQSVFMLKYQVNKFLSIAS